MPTVTSPTAAAAAAAAVYNYAEEELIT